MFKYTGKHTIFPHRNVYLQSCIVFPDLKLMLISFVLSSAIVFVVCVCVRERERVREGGGGGWRLHKRREGNVKG